MGYRAPVGRAPRVVLGPFECAENRRFGSHAERRTRSPCALAPGHRKIPANRRPKEKHSGQFPFSQFIAPSWKMPMARKTQSNLLLMTLAGAVGLAGCTLLSDVDRNEITADGGTAAGGGGTSGAGRGGNGTGGTVAGEAGSSAGDGGDAGSLGGAGDGGDAGSPGGAGDGGTGGSAGQAGAGSDQGGSADQPGGGGSTPEAGGGADNG